MPHEPTNLTTKFLRNNCVQLLWNKSHGAKQYKVVRTFNDELTESLVNETFITTATNNCIPYKAGMEVSVFSINECGMPSSATSTSDIPSQEACEYTSIILITVNLGAQHYFY